MRGKGCTVQVELLEHEATASSSLRIGHCLPTVCLDLRRKKGNGILVISLYQSPQAEGILQGTLP